jgi:2-alkyl-3-oxoalkanoate reductase
MKVFIAGASGVLGRRLIVQFRARGHEVVGLTRSEENEKVVRSMGAESRRADLFDTTSLTRAAEGAEVVIHAATSIPAGPKIAPADWKLNDRIRREGTQALARCAGEVGARLYIQQSIVWVARPPDDSFYDEQSPAHPDRLTQSSLDGERIAAETGAAAGFGVAVLRCGFFYAHDSAQIRMLGAGLRQHRIPLVGSGTCVMAMIHADDAASAFVSTAEAGRGGLWHVVDDRPPTTREFLFTFAEKLGAPTPGHVPEWVARLAAGRDTVAFFTRSNRTSNARIKADVGWNPLYRTIHEGIDQIVTAWKAEGVPG